MSPEDPLANLHPLRQPDMIGWWPPAPGWWLVACLLILAVITLVYLLRRHYRRNAYRRRALLQLQALHAQYQIDGDARDYLGHINALLKSVALLAYPRATVAAEHGQAWREFLNRSLPPTEQLPAEFDSAQYQRECPDVDTGRIHRTAMLWIKKHRAAR